MLIVLSISPFSLKLFDVSFCVGNSSKYCMFVKKALKNQKQVERDLSSAFRPFCYIARFLLVQMA